MYYIYILKSQVSGTYYTGSCQDLVIRLGQHNKGYVKSTRKLKPWELIYREQYNTLSEARKRESEIKSWKSRRRIEILINLGL